MAEREKKTIMLYRNWEVLFKNLRNDEERSRVLMALFAHANGTEMPELSEGAQMALSFMTAQLDIDTKKWEKTCALNSENGRKGGAPKGNKNACKASTDNTKQPKQPKQAKQAKQAKQPDKDKEKDKDKDIAAADNTREDISGAASSVSSVSAAAAEDSRQSDDENTAVGEDQQGEADLSSRISNGAQAPSAMIRNKYGEHRNVLLSAYEYAQLKRELPGRYEHYIERLSGYMAQKGIRYRDHLETMLRWAHEDVTRGKAIPEKGADTHDTHDTQAADNGYRTIEEVLRERLV